MSETTPRPAIMLKSAEFRHGREQSWVALEALLDRVERRGIKSLTADELEQLPLLYRAALSSLSVARAIALDRHLLLYLENLALRAYLIVYSPRQLLFAGAKEFFGYGLPAAVQSIRGHLLVSLLTTVVGCIAGFMLTAGDETWFYTFVDRGLGQGRGPDSTRDSLLSQEIFAPWPGFADSFLLFANYLFQHNAEVAILCFSLGIAAGVPTLLLLLMNGLTLGAFLALHYDRGLLFECIGWLSIHGVTEIAAIILAGAGGLLIAEKILFPGRYSRVESLAQIGGRASRIAIGAVLLLILAGILEGGFRQLVQSTPARLLIGFGVAACWGYYFARPLGDRSGQAAP
jgi:uncharacterized membrane protein SpoIIM required for sporulation